MFSRNKNFADNRLLLTDETVLYIRVYVYTVLKIVVDPFRIREREKEHKAAESKGREKLLFLARQESEGRGEERKRERERERLLRAKYCNEPRRFIGSRDKNLSRYVRETRNRFLRLEGWFKTESQAR